MALIKVLTDGDELIFDISRVSKGAQKRISVMVVKRANPVSVLQIRADASIPILHIRQQRIYDDSEEEPAGS